MYVCLPSSLSLLLFLFSASLSSSSSLFLTHTQKQTVTGAAAAASSKQQQANHARCLTGRPFAQPWRASAQRTAQATKSRKEPIRKALSARKARKAPPQKASQRLSAEARLPVAEREIRHQSDTSPITPVSALVTRTARLSLSLSLSLATSLAFAGLTAAAALPNEAYGLGRTRLAPAAQASRAREPCSLSLSLHPVPTRAANVSVIPRHRPARKKRAREQTRPVTRQGGVPQLPDGLFALLPTSPPDQLGQGERNKENHAEKAIEKWNYRRRRKKLAGQRTARGSPRCSDMWVTHSSTEQKPCPFIAACDKGRLSRQHACNRQSCRNEG